MTFPRRRRATYFSSLFDGSQIFKQPSLETTRKLGPRREEPSANGMHWSRTRRSWAIGTDEWGLPLAAPPLPPAAARRWRRRRKGRWNGARSETGSGVRTRSRRGLAWTLARSRRSQREIIVGIAAVKSSRAASQDVS